MRKKILLSMVFVILLLGLAIALITRAVLFNTLKLEFQRKGLNLARSISANSVIDVLTQNSARLKLLLENEKRLDNDIAYVFIADSSGRVYAHTFTPLENSIDTGRSSLARFTKGFPEDLLTANNIQKEQDFKIQPLDTQEGLIYDIAVPVLSGKSLLAQVRLGLKQNSTQRTIDTLNLFFIGVTLLIMLLGAAIAYKISSLITRPISKLVQATNAIQKGDFSAKIDIRTKDEIEVLARSFNDMLSRLRQLIEEEKRLKVIEERDRIAFDLHDGCAQNMANIIKRLELCEKLLELDPKKALLELESLRKITKDTLQRTRQVIFDLKSINDKDYDLVYNIKNYAANFQKESGILLALDAPEEMNNLPADKTGDIFYIITEALTNIKKHSFAKSAKLSLSYGSQGELCILIKDDGKGFEAGAQGLRPASGKFGLMSMRQRAVSLGAKLLITSKPGQGTEIAACIPLEKKG